MVLTWLDYVVIAGYLIAITAFGLWFARFQKTTRDYFLTGRSVPWWAICFTIVATETSTLSFIGVPAGAYGGNMTFLQLAMGYIVGRLLVSVLFIPAYFRGELYTSYELLQRRFGPEVKNIAAVIFLVTRTLADGVRLFATALVITVVTHVPVTLTIVIVGAAMIIYTTRGGVSAVIWTDVWAGILGGVALTLATHGTDQFLVQRLLSARSAKDAQLGLVLSGFVVFGQFLLFLFIGAFLYVFYQQTPLPRTLTTND
jgi:SSS family solute:Na+ symporter